jgi:hypothetical protein
MAYREVTGRDGLVTIPLASVSFVLDHSGMGWVLEQCSPKAVFPERALAAPVTSVPLCSGKACRGYP